MTGPWITAVVVLWVFVVLLGVLVLGLMRRVNIVLVATEERLRRPEDSFQQGLPVGARVPEFEAVTDSGQVASSRQLPIGPAVYVMLSSACRACDVLLVELADQLDPLGGVALVIVAEDSVHERQRLVALDATRIYQHNGQVARAFACSVTPYAFTVDEDNVVVASGPANRLEQLRELASILNQPHFTGPSTPTMPTVSR